MTEQNTSNYNSEESGHYYGQALWHENHGLDRYEAGRRCASMAVSLKNKYPWLNTEVFTRAAIDMYLGMQAAEGRL